MSGDTAAAAAPSPADRAALRAANTALLVVVVSTFMVSIDSTMVNVALPHIRDDFGAGSSVQWVVSGYLLGVASGYPASGWLADRFGSRRAIVGCIVAFAAASLVSATAWTLPVLVGARIVQGFAGGPISPIGMALILRVCPPSKRGRSLGLWGVASFMAPAIGPTVGGRMVDLISWHWLFVVNVPMAAAGGFLALRHLRDVERPARTPLDLAGLLLGATGLSFLLLTLSQGGRWGWTSPRVLGALAVGVVALTGFVRHELRAEHPALDPRLMRAPLFVLATGIVALAGSSLTARVVFVPLQLADVRGYSATRIGLLLAPAALVTAAGMLIGGRVTDRIGPRVPVVSGTLLLVVSTVAMARWEVGTGDLGRVTAMMGQGFGFGLLGVSCTVTAMSHMRPDRLAQGSTWRMLWQQLGGAVSVAGLAGLLDARTPAQATPAQIQSAHDTLMWVIAGYLAVAALLAWRLPRGRLRPAHVGRDRGDDDEPSEPVA